MPKTDIALLILRLVFGISMACHGWNKMFSPSGLDGTAQWFRSIGMKWPRVQATIASSSEIVAGLLLAAGLFTGLAATIFIAVMFVAIITVHARVGFFIFLPNGGWEYCASIIACATALSLTGAGQYSLDEFWNLHSGTSAWALPAGAALALCHVAMSYRPRRSQPSA